MKPVAVGYRTMLILALATAVTMALGFSDDCWARKSCDESDPEYADTGRRIKCKMENMTEAFDGLMTTAIEDDTGIFTESQKQQMNNIKERAKNDTSRTNASDYKRNAQKSLHEVECVIREIIGDVTIEEDLNGNGICDGDEICLGNEDGICQEDEYVFDAPYKGGCAELIDDGVGDDDGVCDPKGSSGKFRETCLTDCSQDVILAEDNEKNVNRGKADDVEKSIEDMTGVMDEANVEFASMIELRRNMYYVQNLDDGPQTQCEVLYAMVSQDRAINSLGLAFAVATASVAKVVEDACKDTLNFDAIVTASAACIPTTLVGEGLNILAVRLEAIDDAQTGERIDALGECVLESSGGIKEMRQQLMIIRDMLLEPQGQRF